MNPLNRIAELARKAMEHRRHGRRDEARRIQNEAAELALETLKEHPFFEPECEAGDMRFNLRVFQKRVEAIRQALDGEDPPTPKPTKFSRVLSAVSDFCETHGRYPSATDLREMGVHPGEVADVRMEFERLGNKPITAPRKRGRKSDK
jgi:hypothetical protein